jgi:crossover junction endodeoxyribonuclease RusA
MRYIIPAIPPSLNKFAGRENTWEYRRAKTDWIRLVDACCRPRPEQPIEYSLVTLTYHFPDRRRRDPDNYVKFITDGLVRAKIVVDDDFEHMQRYERQGEIDRGSPHVVVEVEPL